MALPPCSTPSESFFLGLGGLFPLREPHLHHPALPNPDSFSWD